VLEGGLAAPQLEFVSTPGFRGDPVEKARGVAVQIPQPLRLQAIGEDA